MLNMFVKKQEKKPEKKPESKDHKIQARTKGEARRVDTRASNVNLDKYNEKYDEMELDIEASSKLRIHHTPSLYSDWTLGALFNYRPDNRADEYKDFYVMAALNYEF